MVGIPSAVLHRDISEKLKDILEEQTLRRKAAASQGYFILIKQEITEEVMAKLDFC